MKESFADESWYGNRWYRTTVSAHVKSPHDWSWVFQLESEARKLGYYGELKASFALQLLNRLNPRLQKRIWQTLQNIPISVIDPKYYLRKVGIVPLNKFCFQIENKGEKININIYNKLFQDFENLLQQYMSERILVDSPLQDIEIAIENISNSFEVFPSMYDFSPKEILNSLNIKDPKKRIINVVELSLRLFSAFYELNDPETKKETVDKISNFGMDMVWPISHYSRELLLQSILSNRFFDEGHAKSIKFIKDLCKKVKVGLSHEIFGNNIILPNTIIEEIKSEKDIRMRASDIASGIARIIYDAEGIKGLERRFSTIFYNGEKI